MKIFIRTCDDAFRISGASSCSSSFINSSNSGTISSICRRYSRYTGKGESIGNQIDLCREYICTHYGDAAAEHAVVFEDEGFSGGNLNRPDFKKMMTAAKDRKFKAIVVYRLDRISRNISDFSSLIEELGRLGIDFVSIRESFDTSSPMGRAMMYIASVFSQLERETIAERIRDNMHELAKTGRWLGGTTPTGYASESVKSITVDGKTKKACKLKLLPDEAEIIYKIFDLYEQYDSLTMTETELLRQGIKTKTGVLSPGFPSSLFCRIPSTSLQTRSPIRILWTTKRSCSHRSQENRQALLHKLQ